jgi:hypothetical protein
MRFKSPFSNTTFDSLKAGDFFFHPLAGGHSPAIKVVRADGEDAVIDLNLEQQRGEPRLPTLMDADAFEGQTVIAVETAFIRPKLGVSNLVNWKWSSGADACWKFLKGERSSSGDTRLRCGFRKTGHEPRLREMPLGR